MNDNARIARELVAMAKMLLEPPINLRDDYKKILSGLTCMRNMTPGGHPYWFKPADPSVNMLGLAKALNEIYPGSAELNTARNMIKITDPLCVRLENMGLLEK